MGKAWIRIRSGRMSSDHNVELTKPATDFVTSEELAVIVEGRKRMFHVEIEAPGTKEKPLYVSH